MYTLDQLERMDDHTLGHKAQVITGCYGADFHTTDSLNLQDQALRLNGIDYAYNLNNVIGNNGNFYLLKEFKAIARMLNATPRERTIAAILTLQGRQQKDIVTRVKQIIGRD